MHNYQTDGIIIIQYQMKMKLSNLVMKVIIIGVLCYLEGLKFMSDVVK